MTSGTPQVSVVMPVYNREVLVERAIKSILDQDFADFEFVIVDDGSTDRTVETIGKFADPRICLTSLPVNCGIATARNVGLKLARGEFIAVMDSDNVALPARLGKQVEFLAAHPEIDILGTNAILVQSTERKSTPHRASDDLIKARLLSLNGSAMFHSTTMVKADFLIATALTYHSVPIDEDHAFWIEAMAAGARFAVLQEFLVERHIHEGNFTSARGIRETDMFRRKTPLRARLLGFFFPQLSHDETMAIATLMEEGRRHSIIDLTIGIAAIRKAGLDGRSYFGESKPEIANILNPIAETAMRALSGKGQKSKS